jgi:hypothetical protein
MNSRIKQAMSILAIIGMNAFSFKNVYYLPKISASKSVTTLRRCLEQMKIDDQRVVPACCARTAGRIMAKIDKCALGRVCPAACVVK